MIRTSILLIAMLFSQVSFAEQWKDFEITKGHCANAAMTAVEAFRQYERGVDRPTLISGLLNPSRLGSVSYRVSLPLLVGLLHDRYAGVNDITSNDAFDVVYRPCKRSIGSKVKYAVN